MQLVILASFFLSRSLKLKLVISALREFHEPLKLTPGITICEKIQQKIFFIFPVKLRLTAMMFAADRTRERATCH